MDPRSPALLLALLALAALAHSGDAACEENEFTCSNGNCTSAILRCNGRDNCGDGSDEEASMCDKLPTVRLARGDRVTMRAQYKREYGGVVFQFCNASSCNKLVLGHLGEARYYSMAECNPLGGMCGGEYTVLLKVPYGRERVEDSSLFPDGELVFWAERRAGELAVWLAGHEDKTVTVAVPAGSDLLRVRPYSWTTDMPVEFIESDAVTGLEALPSADAVQLSWGLPARLRGFVLTVTRVAQAGDESSAPDPQMLAERRELAAYETLVRGLQPGATYRAAVQGSAASGGAVLLSEAAAVVFSTPAGREAAEAPAGAHN